MLFPPIIFLVGAFTFLGALLFLEKGAGVTLAPDEKTRGSAELDGYIKHSPRLKTPFKRDEETLIIDGVTFEEYIDTVTDTYIPTRIAQAKAGETPLQSELRTYGNAVGKISITEIGNSEQQLRQFQDKEYAILATAYRDAASNLERLNPPPLFKSPLSQFVTAHTQLADALVDLTQSENSESFSAYNKTVEAYVQALLLHALLFSAAGITFTENESGYLFTQIATAGR